ncbi:MAG: hypothetical protein HOM57_14480 [Gemmatimonadales bacterium]|nr:hypothetical protein [Gemmatimonadales bacterium]
MSGGGARGQSTRTITAEDLVPGRYSNAMDTITKLHPGWMNRVTDIFADGHRIDEEDLRLETPASIQSISLLQCEQAMIKCPVSCVSQTYLEIVRRR